MKHKQSNTAMLMMSIAVLIFLITSCGTATDSTLQPESEVITSVTTTQTSTPAVTATPQSFSTPVSYGSDIENFPANFNPLTGQEVKDPSQLQVPALLVSISHFPSAARPQYGLSYAPLVFEFYITEGATRFLSVFYGTFPEAEPLITGGCEIRTKVFVKTKNIIGNYVWLDENKNGTQEDYEKGVAGVCVSLYDSSNQLVEQTTTDSNGYYGFNVDSGNYFLQFDLPEWFEFTKSNVGDEKKIAM